MLYSGKKFSLLGDSVSTFQGYTAPSGVFYGRAVCRKAGVTSVSDTWWMRVIQALGGALEVNNSYSGSCVAPVGLGGAASRAGALGHPDVILAFMGANDAIDGVHPTRDGMQAIADAFVRSLRAG